MDTTYVFLAVSGYGDDPAPVTQLLGAPTRVLRRGEPVPGTSSRHALEARWELHSPLAPAAPLEAHLAALLPLLEQRATAVRTAAQRYRALLRVASYVLHPSNGGVQLGAALLARVAALGVDLDLDLYVLRPDDASPDVGTSTAG